MPGNQIDLAPLIQPFVPLLSTLAGAGAALMGILINQRWTTRREFAKRRLNLADDMLATFYEAAAAIDFIRSRARQGDGRSRVRRENEMVGLSGALDSAYAPQERINAREKAFDALTEKKFKCMVAFRGDSHRPFIRMETVMQAIFASSNILVEELLPRAHAHPSRLDHSFPTEEARDDFENTIKRHQAIIQARDDGDPIQARLSEAIQLVEAIADKAVQEYNGMGKSFKQWWKDANARAERAQQGEL